MKKRQTSVIAYNKKLADGSIISDKEAVYRALKRIKYGTKEDIANVLNWPQERVHKRCSELLKDGKIIYTDVKVKAGTGHLQAYWAITGVKEIKLKVA